MATLASRCLRRSTRHTSDDTSKAKRQYVLLRVRWLLLSYEDVHAHGGPYAAMHAYLPGAIQLSRPELAQMRGQVLDFLLQLFDLAKDGSEAGMVSLETYLAEQGAELWLDAATAWQPVPRPPVP